MTPQRQRFMRSWKQNSPYWTSEASVKNVNRGTQTHKLLAAERLRIGQVMQTLDTQPLVKSRCRRCGADGPITKDYGADPKRPLCKAQEALDLQANRNTGELSMHIGDAFKEITEHPEERFIRAEGKGVHIYSSYVPPAAMYLTSIS